MTDNIQDPNDPNDVRRRQNPQDPQPGSTQGGPDEPQPEGTTGREEPMPLPDENVPREQRDEEYLKRPDERRDSGE